MDDIELAALWIIITHSGTMDTNRPGHPTLATGAAWPARDASVLVILCWEWTIRGLSVDRAGKSDIDGFSSVIQFYYDMLTLNILCLQWSISHIWSLLVDGKILAYMEERGLKTIQKCALHSVDVSKVGWAHFTMIYAFRISALHVWQCISEL
jgi:hypothetical protein